MTVKFANIVDEISILDIESKEYLMDLIKKQLVAERRKEIKKHADESIEEYHAGKIKFGSLKQLKIAVHED